MDLKVYFNKDKVLATINYMAYARTKEELDVLFADAIEELLEYQLSLKEEIECDKLSYAENTAIRNSVYGICNKK